MRLIVTTAFFRSSLLTENEACVCNLILFMFMTASLGFDRNNIMVRIVKEIVTRCERIINLSCVILTIW